jgi:integrase
MNKTEKSKTRKRGQGEGSIYQRADGRWCGVVTVGTVNGTRSRKSFYAATRGKVQVDLNKALTDIRNGLPLLQEKQTVANYLDWWIKHVAKATVRPATWESYATLVRLHLAPAFKKVPLSKLTPQHVRGMLHEKGVGGLSARRVQYIHAVLRAALNTAFRDQLVVRNVAAVVKPPRTIGKEVKPLTTAEARAFLSSVNGSRLEALFVVALSLGLRQGESLGVRWRDIDFERATLRVRYALQKLKVKADADTGPSSFHLVEPKTKSSRRTIALPEATRNALLAYRIRQAEERTLAGARWQNPTITCEGQRAVVDDLVFTTRVGSPLPAGGVTRRFQAHLKAVGVSTHRFHDLRHTAATLLSVQGVHPRAIQAALGWESPNMLTRYSHFVEEQRAAVASAMESILNPVAVNVAVKPEEASKEARSADA